MKVTAILKGGKDDYGRYRIHIRVSTGAKRKFFRTQMRVEKNQFDKGKVRNHPQAVLYNSEIKRLLLENESLRGKIEDKSFFKYFLECASEWEKIKADGTFKQYNSEIKKLKGFSPGLTLAKVTPDFLNDYKKFILKTNSVNTAWKTFKFLRLIIRKAHKSGLIAHNPFDVFEMPKYKDPEKTYLTKDQVEAIDLASEGMPKEYKLIGTWFVIACYTGLRFSDQVAFNKKQIKGGRLITHTAKTGGTVSMPFFDHLKRLFERIDYSPVTYHNVHYNRLIKDIALQCGIEEHVSAHTARHTFGVLCADAGISQEVTAKLMGHKRLSTTSIYYKITNPRIDEELKKLG